MVFWVLFVFIIKSVAEAAAAAARVVCDKLRSEYEIPFEMEKSNVLKIKFKMKMGHSNSYWLGIWSHSM